MHSLNKLLFFCTVFWLFAAGRLSAQVLYVDAAKGREEAKGTATDPLASLEKAVALAGSFTGNEPVTIKIHPGLYVLRQQAILRTARQSDDTLSYTLEAAVLPGDSAWQPGKMPVIQSVSPNNSEVQFVHAVGFLVGRSNVSFRGLKFLGNAHPEVAYYYPITRENESYRGLTVSQCMFIGEKNSAPIQAAIWAHGAGTHVDHSVFYGCKNAFVLIKAIRDFSLTHSIIHGAYEAAVWHGPDNDPQFTFRNNIVTGCNFFWLRPENTAPAYTFSHSLIANNRHYMGLYTRQGPVEAPKNAHQEAGIRKTGNVQLREVDFKGVPKDYLHPAPGSDGHELKAGLFREAKQ